MKVAVTGASGFIGRHVLHALAQAKDVEVIAATRRPARDGLSEGIRHVVLDLTAPSSDDFLKLGEPDVVIHLAWHGLPNYLARHHFESELGVQYRFLRGLVDAGLSSLLCTGTCFEYGMQSGELHESLPTNPSNPYGFAKDALRRELEFLRDGNRFQLTWARLFYMHGEGQAPSSLYSQFVAAGSRGDKVFKMSGGEQLRDYLHVSQVAQALVALACKQVDTGIVNVCAGHPTSVRALVEGWLATHPWPMTLALGHYPYPTYEPMAFWGSNARLTQLLR
ncbi:NAD(P)-dependent oxidoreductase [Variovorax sp. EL159]|uniref:NAD-dependent epimerase/dehydratase family protein n=1 Tax=Variovorax sp. EL159 TaxID=1566270 RepID=UPI000888D00C|nr:NAD-dependent epimerase/dehydratase family protein [Variovorax sp. EL159]SCX38729.1 dTDP-6-deoxy-L-talose 4-dehydrogenase (NAD+) [Variovorax sp. EL159]